MKKPKRIIKIVHRGAGKNTVMRESMLKHIINDTLWMAIRYAHGRHTYAPGMVRDAVKHMKVLFPDWTIKADRTIEAPEKGEVRNMSFRDDWLDDLFTTKK